MKKFKAIVQNKGKIESIIVDALNEDDAERQVKSYGKIVKITKKKGFSFQFKLEIQHRQIIFHRLSAMLGSKVGTGQALNLMEEHFGHPIGTTCGKLKKQVDLGYTLDKAMENLGEKYFPRNVVALIQAGFKSGNSAKSLINAAEFEREMESIRKSSMLDIYISIGTFFIAAIATFGTTRYFAPLMADSSLMKMSEAGKPDMLYVYLGHAAEISMGITAIIFIFLLSLGTIGRLFNPSLADSIIVKVPFYKDLVLAKNNYITLYSLSLLIGSGVSIEPAIALSAEGAPKGKMKDDLNGALDNVKKGLPWANKMTSLHPTDRAALGQSLNIEGIINALSSLSMQYRALYASRLATLGPALKSVSALFITLSGIILFGLTLMPILKMAGSGF